MLVRLRIRNLAIIDDLGLDFAEGFTALTGETGAGKSIIIGALNLVLGERASADDVRTGCDGAEVEALFDIGGHDGVARLLAEINAAADDDGAPAELVLRREVSAQGRGRCLVNGRLVPLGQMKQVGDLLVDLHGQHQHQSLLRVELHREILDTFGGAVVERALTAYRSLYSDHGEVIARLRALDRDEREIERQKGLLEFQLKEIHDATLDPGEDQSLEDERHRLEHAETLRTSLDGATDALYEGEAQSPTVADLLAQIEDLVAGAARLDPSLSPIAERLTAARAETDDIAATLRSYTSGLEADPGRLAEVDDRLQLIRQLRRKYGASIEEILDASDGFEKELDALTHSREEQERLKGERAALEKKLAEAAETLSAKRRAAATKFSKGLRGHLAELEMPEVRFQVRLHREEIAAAGVDTLDEENGDQGADASPSPTATAAGTGGYRTISFPGGKRFRLHGYGVDQVEFLISPNPGEDLKTLRRIASGGELSRIMLALKTLMRDRAPVPTLIFDEIDTGISGRTGSAIGEKMATLGETHQVLCITHLPQIAARATQHFAVRKVREKKRSLTRVELIDDEGRYEEIARLLGGEEDSDIARTHARELLAATKQSATTKARASRKSGA